MALDPSIILAAVPDIDVQGERLKRQNVKDAVLGNEINQYKLNQAKQADERTSNLRDIFSQNADDMLPGALKAGGYIDEYNAFNKQKQEQAQGTLKNRTVELENAKKKIDLSGQAMGALMQNPTDENLQTTLKGLVQNGVMTPEEAQAAYDKGPKDPEGIKALATQHYQSALDTKDQLEKFSTHNTGQQTVTQGVNPVTGATRTVGTLQNTQDPNSVASVANQAQQGDLNRQVQMRGQDITARGQDITANTANNRLNQANANGGYSTKPLPATALKLQNEGLEALNLASNIDKDLGAIENQLNNGSLKLGVISNLEGKIRNATGNSDKNSRNLATFRSTLEKLRNDSLKLNKGVQTEGDAQRAWNEILTNINDQEYVKQRLGEVRILNQRAADLHKNNVDNIRSNYNAAPLDYSRYENQPAAVGDKPTKNAKIPQGKVKTAEDFLKAKGL